MRQLRRKRILRRLLAFGLPALLVLTVATAVVIPMIKDWRARQFVERAKELSAQGKLQEAFNNAASAMQMRPALPEVKRTYARVLLAANEPACLQVMQQLDLMVTMDSANMHLASLVEVPVVSVWGATHPYAGFYGYNQDPSNAVQVGLSCRPCSVFGNKSCWRGDHACMNGITTAMVIANIEEVIGRV